MNILVLYAYKESPMRSSLKDHLFSFKRYLDDNVFYANLAKKRIPKYLRIVEFDLVVFHTLFSSNHWAGKKEFDKLKSSAGYVKKLACPKVLLPQDEFVNSDLLSDLIDEFDISKVFTVSPLNIIPTIYKKVKKPDVDYERILTGYIDERMIGRVEQLSSTITSRSIDIGYRASGKPQAWWGKLGFQKQLLADAVISDSSAKNLKLDISVSGNNTLIGDAWLKYLLSCRYTIGTESGTSLVDNDGSIREVTETYVRSHPSATFEEIEEKCFPNRDGVVKLNAISPRHFEACITRTCQVLIEGEYNGILQSGIHYIPIKNDLSDLSEVLNSLADEGKRKRIVEKAYADIVSSGLYTYSEMVKRVVGGYVGNELSKNCLQVELLLLINRIFEWCYEIFILRPRNKTKKAAKMLKRFFCHE